MKKLAAALLFFLVFSGFLTPVHAQENMMKDQLFFVHEEVVPVNMISLYEKTSKEFMQLFADKKLDVPAIYASQTNDNHFDYLVPISNYADIDKINQAFGDFNKSSAGDSYQQLMDQNSSSIDFTHDFVIRKSNDLSYEPKNNSMKMEDMKFIHWDYYTVRTGKMKEVSELGKKIKDLYTAKGISTPYDVWFVDMGANNNLAVVTIAAKNAADYYESLQKDSEMLGKDMDDIWQQMMPMLTKFEEKNGMMRQDLNYVKNKD
jgi:hypothetical protein